MPSGLTIVVMGVCGCGKSSVAEQLAEQLGGSFKDGDELHPVSNVKRMSQGLPLTDSDRWPWLESVAGFAQVQSSNARVCVIACSALKKSYREVINQAGRVLYVYLHGSRGLIQARMSQRENHFMPAALIDSQFADLEVPDAVSEQVVTVDIRAELDDVVDSAVAQVRAHALFLSV